MPTPEVVFGQAADGSWHKLFPPHIHNTIPPVAFCGEVIVSNQTVAELPEGAEAVHKGCKPDAEDKEAAKEGVQAPAPQP